MQVPFVDLRAQYLAHRQDIDAAIADVINATAFIGGERVKRFDREFAQALGIAHSIGCGNGTDAIYIVMRMLGIGDGDEVITTAMSWISTSETISQTGATPVFVDVDDYFGIDVAAIEKAITPRTRAIIPVHLYGQPCDMGAIMEIAKRRNLHVIEDCAQAHLATFAGRKVGTWGVAATFSFYPGKNLGAYGDAGCMVTGDAKLAEDCRRYANHGALVKHQHDVEGVNSRLDGLQAAILSAKLPYLQQWTAKRNELADRYDALLAGIPGIEIPRRRPNSTHVFHLYVIQADRREQLRDHLKTRGIECQIHYPTALPFMKAYARLGGTPEQFPRASRKQHQILSLPMYAELEPAQLEYVCNEIASFYGGRRA